MGFRFYPRGGNLVTQYIPNRGDIVWLEFNPQKGREQAGRRPALVLSPRLYNQKVGLALFVPITSVKKGYPFEVSLPEHFKINGVILSDQIKNFDWKSRRSRYIATLPNATYDEVLAKISAIIF